MLSNKSQKLLNNLEGANFKLALLASAKYPGEDFHNGYKKYPQLFSKIVKSDTLLYKAMRQYFDELTVRVHKYINWPKYQFEVHTASATDFIEADWSGETLILKVLITDALKSALLAGGQMTEMDTKIDVGWSTSSSPALKFLSDYSLKLAGDLTDTTIERVKSSLMDSLSSGLSQTDAADALNDVIDDPRRAATIAHTEAVRAFSQGRLEVGKEVGADRKQWSATSAPCPICADLDGQVVGIEEDFDDGNGEPPAHPNCRCLIRILMPNEDPVESNSEEE